MRAFLHFEGVVGSSFLIELDAEPGAFRREQVTGFVRDLDGKYVFHDFAADEAAFLNREVVGRQVEMQTGRRRDRAERIMGDNFDVVGLAPVCDFFGLS